MSNSFFRFKQFTIHQDRCAMKVTTDSCLFGAWLVHEIEKDLLKIENCLDIGTGTGLLSLMLSQKFKQTFIDAIEINEDAAIQARENVEAFPMKNMIRVIHADAVSYSSPGKYDVIISNPPFYENELNSPKLEKNIAHHQESLLLSQLLSIIKTNLKPGGIFFIMLPFKREIELKTLLWNQEFFVQKICYVKQTPGHNHFRMFLRGGDKAIENTLSETDEIIIKNEQQQYTDHFQYLLNDYYLYL